MFELLLLKSPSDSDTSSTYFQVRDSGSGIFKLLIITRNRNADCYCEPVRGWASEHNALPPVSQKANDPRY